MLNYKYDVLTLTASNYNTKLTIELPKDSNADDVFDAFQTILIGLGYPRDIMDMLVLDKAEELKEKINDITGY
jgi:hypothetical protein